MFLRSRNSGFERALLLPQQQFFVDVHTNLGLHPNLRTALISDRTLAGCRAPCLLLDVSHEPRDQQHCKKFFPTDLDTTASIVFMDESRCEAVSVPAPSVSSTTSWFVLRRSDAQCRHLVLPAWPEPYRRKHTARSASAGVFAQLDKHAGMQWHPRFSPSNGNPGSKYCVDRSTVSNCQ